MLRGRTIARGACLSPASQRKSLPPPEPRRDEARHELTGGDRGGAGGDDVVVPLGGDVVVVAVEAALGDAQAPGEDVQLVEVRVAHQMRPHAAVRRPERVVDEDRHDPILRRHAGPDRALLRLVAASGKVFLWCVEKSAPSLM